MTINVEMIELLQDIKTRCHGRTHNPDHDTYVTFNPCNIQGEDTNSNYESEGIRRQPKLFAAYREP